MTIEEMQAKIDAIEHNCDMDVNYWKMQAESAVANLASKLSAEFCDITDSVVGKTELEMMLVRRLKRVRSILKESGCPL